MAVLYPQMVSGFFRTFAYFYADEATGVALLVDPGAQPAVLMNVAAEHGWRVERILLTHGHYDHWGAAERLAREWGCPVSIHERGLAYLERPALNLSASWGAPAVLRGAQTFGDGSVFTLPDGADVRVLHTPGHTDDSCVFYLPREEAALVGDVVYDDGPGLTSFPTGNARVMEESFARLRRELPPQTLLLSGHSRAIELARVPV